MSLRSGLASQWGMAKESTYGVVVTPTRFHPMVSESLDQKIARIESDAIIAGRLVIDSTQWAPGDITVGGDVGFELYDRGIGVVLEQMFGGAAISGSDPYTQTYTPGDLTGISFTGQVGVPDTGGTVRPQDLAGTQGRVVGGRVRKEGQNVTLRPDRHGRAMYRLPHRHRRRDDRTASATITSATGAFSTSDIGSPISGTGIPASTTIASVRVLDVGHAVGGRHGDRREPSRSRSARRWPRRLPVGHHPVPLHRDDLHRRRHRAEGEERRRSPATTSSRSAASVGLGHDRRAVRASAHRDYNGELEVEFSDLTIYDRYVRGAESALVVRARRATRP
jgi:hypothetical protein